VNGEEQTCTQAHVMPPGSLFCPQCGEPARQAPARESAATFSPEAESVVHSFPATPADQLRTAGTDVPRRKGRRLLGVVLALTLVGGVAAAGWFFLLRTTDEDRYVTELKTSGLLAGFATTEVAIAQGHAFCTKLETATLTQGYRRQRIAVKNLCPEFLAGFVVLPTPMEQQGELTRKLRLDGLGGKFSSDAAAVAHATSFCQKLDDGGVQQGVQEDAIAVSVYCKKYTAGFKTLHPILVKGSIELLDYDPSTYYPSISGGASSCEGDGGYADITTGTEVVVQNAQGTVLTTTQLGRGTGLPPITCEFKFAFTVMDGEVGKYSITVADRGELHYTAAQLKVPRTVELTIGE
jgi:hypothetical protein